MNWPEFTYPIADTIGRIRSLASGLIGGGYPLHREERVRPFFIVGSGRCGTTLLRRILQAGDQVHIPPEMYVFKEARDFFRRHRDRPWNFLVRNVLAMFEFHPEFDAFEISLRPLAAELAELPKESRSLASIFDRLYRYHGEQKGQVFERWADKTPLNAYFLEAILTVFPDAIVVHMLRDGVDVAYSRFEAGMNPDLLSAALRWQSATVAVSNFSEAHPGRCTEVRYEELVSDPGRVVEQLCSFLGLNFDPDMISSRDHVSAMGDVAKLSHHASVHEAINSESVGRGRRALSDLQKRELHEAIGSELHRLRYDPLC